MSNYGENIDNNIARHVSHESYNLNNSMAIQKY